MALNTKLQTFVDVFDGDANKAADIAGISQQYGRRLVMSTLAAGTTPKSIEVQEAIRQRRATQLAPDIANRQRRQRFWTESMDDGELSMSDRLRASELLGKSEADFVDVIKGADSMLLVLGSPRKQIESKVIEGKESHVQGQAEAEGSEPRENEEDASQGDGATN